MHAWLQFDMQIVWVIEPVCFIAHGSNLNIMQLLIQGNEDYEGDRLCAADV